MSNRFVIYLTILVLCGMGIVFALNTLALFWGNSEGTYLSHDEVRGMATQHKQKLYTLNFSQQNQVLSFLNTALPIGPQGQEKEIEKPAIEKIVIYRFNAPDIAISPIAYSDGNLIFSAPEWRPQGHLMETSKGKLKNLLSETYDP